MTTREQMLMKSIKQTFNELPKEIQVMLVMDLQEKVEKESTLEMCVKTIVKHGHIAFANGDFANDYPKFKAALDEIQSRYKKRL
jgi:hypothetical protein